LRMACWSPFSMTLNNWDLLNSRAAAAKRSRERYRASSSGRSWRAQPSASRTSARAGRIAFFLDEFGPQACGNGPDAWEGFGPWAAAAAAHVYAAALHAGLTHVSYYSWNGDPANPNVAGYGLVNGKSTVDANFWGVWLASRFVAGAATEIAVDGVPAGVRAFAVRSAMQLKVLLLNASPGSPAKVTVAVEGGTAGPATQLRLDPSYASKGVPSVRSAVPQTAPRPVPANLKALTLPALSATLLEMPVANERGGGDGEERKRLEDHRR